MRSYICHHWIAQDNGAVCFVCGITERVFNARIANAPMIEWDCLAVRDRNSPRSKPVSDAGHRALKELREYDKRHPSIMAETA